MHFMLHKGKLSCHGKICTKIMIKFYDFSEKKKLLNLNLFTIPGSLKIFRNVNIVGHIILKVLLENSKFTHTYIYIKLEKLMFGRKLGSYY